MAFDISSYFGTVTRVVEDGARDGKPTKVVIATRRYDTDPDDLWHALTDRERLPRWFAPVSGDLVVGGRFQVQGNAGGEITTCDPPAKLSVTWEMRGDVSWVDLELAPEDDGTRLTLRHTAHPPEDFWPVFGPGAVGVGWDLALMGLAMHLSDREANVSAEQSATFHTTDDGKRFIRHASDDWGRAAIAGGEAKDQALAAAERTRAFYSGEAAPG